MLQALLYGNKLKEISSILPNYEILLVEPCRHDFPGNIKNVCTELSHYLNQNERKIIQDDIRNSFAKRTQKEVLKRKCITGKVLVLGKVFSLHIAKVKFALMSRFYKKF